MQLTSGVLLIIVVLGIATLAILLWSRRHEAAAPADALHRPAKSGPSMPARNAGEIQPLVSWLLDRASEETGMRLEDDPLVRERIGQAALKAMEELRSGGSASINLPFIAADARGPKHFAIELKRNPDLTFERLS